MKYNKIKKLENNNFNSLPNNLKILKTVLCPNKTFTHLSKEREKEIIRFIYEGMQIKNIIKNNKTKQ